MYTTNVNKQLIKMSSMSLSSQNMAQFLFLLVHLILCYKAK